MAKAKDICIEQTVEFPEDLLPEGDIRDQIIGQIVDFSPCSEDEFLARISYPVEDAGGTLVQFLNIVFGNISIKPGIRVEALDLPASILNLFRGPRLGRDGLRRLLQAPQRPLLCTALKPMGLSPKDLASQAYQFALGGIDIIKDDHGLGNQPFCPYDERVYRCAQAVSEANQKSGLACHLHAELEFPIRNTAGKSAPGKRSWRWRLSGCACPYWFRYHASAGRKRFSWITHYEPSLIPG